VGNDGRRHPPEGPDPFSPLDLSDLIPRVDVVELAQFCRADGINLVDFLRDARLA
jgi:hypothetical protein